MAPSKSPQSRPVPLLQFIIALQLVKLKPSNLSNSGEPSYSPTSWKVSQTLTDFRKQIASHIEKAPHSNHSMQTDTHSNTTAFWRDRSNRLEAKNAALEAEVARLLSELEKRELARKRNSAEGEHSPRSQRLKRRRDIEPAEELRSRSMKQARTQAGAVTFSERDQVLQDLISNETGSELDEVGEWHFPRQYHSPLTRPGNNLLDALSNLQGSSIARNGNSVGPKDLALRLISIAADVCDHVCAIDLPANFQVTNTALLAAIPRSKEQVAAYHQTSPEEVMERRLIAIGQTFPHFLVHLHTLSRISEDGNLCGQVVYRFIDVFRVLYQRICDLAVAFAKSNQDSPKITKKQGNGQKDQGAMSSSNERPATSPTIMKLCKLLITMLLHLDPMKLTHKEILEGCLYLLVTRVGEVLKDFTIGGRPYGILEDDTTWTHSTRTREGRQLKIFSAANDTEASKAQAPYLIWMLKRAQPFISSTGLATNAMTSSQDDHRQPEGTLRDSSRNAKLDDARIRLQHTLVKAVFGDQAATIFQPALEPPQVPNDDDLMTELETRDETADVTDWFKNEVWRLVGWDVLRGNISWH